MRKIINDPEGFVDEFVDSLLESYSSIASVGGDRRVIARSTDPAGRVGIVTGGGSGHLPLFVGYVGEGLCSAAAIGNVFSSPSPEQLLSATHAASEGAGVVYIYGNYGGDVLNFDLAAESAELDGISVDSVVVHDDVMSAPTERSESRRGVAGMTLVFKCAGAAAHRGDDLSSVVRIATEASNRVLTAGVGLGPTIMPTTGRPSFELDEGEMEIGIGIHGEAGQVRIAIESANEITQRLTAPILAELGISEGDRVAVLVNGLGATPPEELYLMAAQVRRDVGKRGGVISHQWVGEYATSLEMSGASVSIMHLTDELDTLLGEPSSSPLVRF